MTFSFCSALFSDAKFRFHQVLLGQCIGIALLFGVSVVGSLLALVVSPASVGLLGIVPIILGIKGAWGQRKDAGANEEEEHIQSAAGRGNVVAVATVTVANGADNISIYTPVLATRSGYDIALIGLVFFAMTLMWIGAAHWLTNHKSLGAPIRRYGHRVVPYILIGLGLLILYESGSFSLVGL